MKGKKYEAPKKDRIKESLARPNMSQKPSLTHAAGKKGKNFMPKGFKKSK